MNTIALLLYTILYNILIQLLHAQATCSSYTNTIVLGSTEISYVSTSTTISMQLKTSEQAWVGLGRSQFGDMVGSEAVIGLPSESTVGYFLLDGFYLGAGGVYTSSAVRLTNTSISQTSTGTVLKFTQKLADGRFSLPSSGSAIFIYAIGCDNILGFHCSQGTFAVQLSPCVTSQPTVRPAVESTRIPTTPSLSKPSAKPSFKSSVKATVNPKAKPTRRPTLKPSATPSLRPSAKPSAKPTAVPSSKPIPKPPVKPSARITETLTSIPTAKLSLSPTSKPSSKPSEKSSLRPSILSILARPTSKPAVTPNTHPTAMLINNITVMPTGKPIPTKPTTKPLSRPITIKSSSVPTKHPRRKSRRPRVRNSRRPRYGKPRSRVSL